MAIRKEPAIVLLERQRITFCARNSTGAVIFNFPSDLVRDVEIVNKDQFITQLIAFIETNKLPSSIITIFLTNDVLFEKDSIPPDAPVVSAVSKGVAQPGISPEKGRTIQSDPFNQEEEIQRFLDTIPFEHIANKIYPLTKGIKIVATNRDFYETVKQAFEHKGSIVEAILPVFIIRKPADGPFVPSAALVRQISGKTDFFRQQSFPLHFAEVTPVMPQKKGTFTLTKGGNSQRLIALGGVFIILLGIMGFMYTTTFLTGSTTTATHASVKTTIALPSVFTSPTVQQPATMSVTLPSAVASLSANEVTATRIQLLTNTGITPGIQQVKNTLTANGFRNVIVSTSSGITSSNVLIIFSHTVSQAIRDKVILSVHPVIPQFSSQESTESPYDVTITGIQ